MQDGKRVTGKERIFGIFSLAFGVSRQKSRGREPRILERQDHENKGRRQRVLTAVFQLSFCDRIRSCAR